MSALYWVSMRMRAASHGHAYHVALWPVEALHVLSITVLFMACQHDQWLRIAFSFTISDDAIVSTVLQL